MASKKIRRRAPCLMCLQVSESLAKIHALIHRYRAGRAKCILAGHALPRLYRQDLEVAGLLGSRDMVAG